MCKLPYPIAAIATVRRPSKEPSLRAVIPPEARRPPPRVAELARVGVARVGPRWIVHVAVRGRFQAC